MQTVTLLEKMLRPVQQDCWVDTGMQVDFFWQEYCELPVREWSPLSLVAKNTTCSLEEEINGRKIGNHGIKIEVEGLLDYLCGDEDSLLGALFSTECLADGFLDALPVLIEEASVEERDNRAILGAELLVSFLRLVDGITENADAALIIALYKKLVDFFLNSFFSILLQLERNILVLMTPLNLSFYGFLFLLERRDARILCREVLEARMEGLGISLLLLERECCRQHDDGDAEVVAPGEQTLDGGFHVGIIGVKLVDNEDFRRKADKAQDGIPCHHDGEHSLINRTDGIRLEETALERRGEDGIFVAWLLFEPCHAVHELGF